MKLSVDDLKSLLGVPSSVDIAVVGITPDVADTILAENNDHNRKISLTQVQQIRGQIERGEFFLSTDCLGFNSEGTITNGQHRLTAISMLDSGYRDKSYPFGVMFGVSQNMDMDTGKKRTLKENALLYDDYDPRLKEAGNELCLPVIQCAVKFMKGDKSPKKYSQKEYVNITNFFADELVYCSQNGIFRKVKDLSVVVYSAFFVAHLCGVSADVLTNIIDVVENHSYSGDDNKPIFALYNKLRLERSSNGVILREKYCAAQECISLMESGKKGSRRLKGDKFIYTYDECPYLK